MCGCLSLALLAVVMWPLVWLLMRLDPNLRRGRKFQAELAARGPVPDAEMVGRYFAADDVALEVPAVVRRVFARHTGYPADKLLPDDDLAFFWADMGMEELIEELESGFGIRISRQEERRTPCTIRAASLLVASKARRTNRCSRPGPRLGFRAL